MAKGLKQHLKRLNAPKHWMLDKLGGAFVISILMQRHVLVDGKLRTDKTYPSGFMDVISIPKTNENFPLLYDTKGPFRLHSIRNEEAKVRPVQFGQKGIPYINTYDGRTIRYPDPLIKANKISDFIKFDVGNVVMVTGGRNRGRVGVIKNREKHKGSFETIHAQAPPAMNCYSARLGNLFTIGKGTKPWGSLPKAICYSPTVHYYISSFSTVKSLFKVTPLL